MTFFGVQGLGTRDEGLGPSELGWEMGAGSSEPQVLRLRGAKARHFTQDDRVGVGLRKAVVCFRKRCPPTA